MADITRGPKKQNPYAGFGSSQEVSDPATGALIEQLQQAINLLSLQVNKSNIEDRVDGALLTTKEVTLFIQENQRDIEELQRRRPPKVVEQTTGKTDKVWVISDSKSNLPSASTSTLTLLGRVDNAEDDDHGKIYKINAAETAWEEIMTASSSEVLTAGKICWEGSLSVHPTMPTDRPCIYYNTTDYQLWIGYNGSGGTNVWTPMQLTTDISGGTPA